MAKAKVPMLFYNIHMNRRSFMLTAAMAVGLPACKKKSPSAPSDGGTPGSGGSIITPSPGPMEFYSPDQLARIKILTMPGPGSQLKVGSTPPIEVEYWQDLFDGGSFNVFVSNDGVSLVADPIITDGKTDGYKHYPFVFLSRNINNPNTLNPVVKKGETVQQSIGIRDTITPGVSGALTEINFLAFAFWEVDRGRGWRDPSRLSCNLEDQSQCNHWQVAIPTGGWAVIR